MNEIHHACVRTHNSTNILTHQNQTKPSGEVLISYFPTDSTKSELEP